MSRPATFVAAAAVVAALLVGAYVAAGGTSYRPSASPDPCAPRHWPPVSGATQIAEQMTLSALAGAACALGVRPEELTIAFANRAGLAQFAREHHISRSRLDDAARLGIGRAIDDGERSGALNGLEATALRLAAGAAPIDRLIEYVQQALS